jgi:hypothetical protein
VFCQIISIEEYARTGANRVSYSFLATILKIAGIRSPKRLSAYTRLQGITTQEVLVTQNFPACDVLRTGTVREPRRKGISAVGSRYQTTASEDCEDFMYAVVTLIFGECSLVRLSQLFLVMRLQMSNKSRHQFKPRQLSVNT